jgi:hypothetical protein
LIVEVALSEGDAGRVKVGQSAIIYGGGVGAVQLKGIVASVAGEARASMAPGGPSFVAARIRVDTPGGQGAAVRIGSTANVSIVVHSAANALVVPPEAVMGQPPSGQLIVRDPRTGRDQSQSVSIGYTAPDGVEITSGLRPGQTVIWRVASPDGGRR